MFSVSGYAHLMTNPVYYGQLRLYGHEIDAESHSQKGIVGSVLLRIQCIMASYAYMVMR